MIDEAAVAAAVKIPGVDEPKKAVVVAAPKSPVPELAPAPVPALSSTTPSAAAPEEPVAAPAVVAPAPEPVVVTAPAPEPPAATTSSLPKPPPPPPPQSAAVSLPSTELDLPAGLSAPLIGGGLLAAFAAATFAMRQNVDEEKAAAAPAPAASAPAPAPASPASTDDLSIPYDAAARLAYDAWRAEFNKGDFDASKYETFKTNYETVTVANVSEKKKAQDTGGTAKTYALNEDGDQPGGADKVLG